MKRILELTDQPVEPHWFDPPYLKSEIIPDELDIQRYVYLNLPNEEQYQYCENLRQHLLNIISNGHSLFGPNQSIKEIITSIKKLIEKSDVANVQYSNGNKYLTHTNLNVSSQWFPEMFDTKINNKSCLDQIRKSEIFHTNFNDIFIKDRHKVGIRKRDSNWVSDTMLSSMRIVNGFQPAFNFPATLSKFIYLYYHEMVFQKNTEFRVLDTCAGWSGRLAGLLAAFCSPEFDDVKVSYHCTDVNSQTKNRFEMIIGFWNHYINSKIEQSFDFYRSFTPAEELLTDQFFKNKENFYDFSFTSPPYFNRELYSDDETQSSNRYKTYPEWRDGFLFGFIESNYRLLKPNGHFWLNIADINKNKGDRLFYPLQEDSLRFAKIIGFEHIDTWYMLQNPFPGSYSTQNMVNINGKRYKYEPIHILQKL